MKALSIAAVAALLVLSPAYAKKVAPKPAEPPQKVECFSPDAFISSAPKALKLTARLEGDALAQFKAKVADHIPNDTDAVLIFKRDDDVSVLVGFKGGCAQGFVSIPTKLVAKLLDDGSI